MFDVRPIGRLRTPWQTTGECPRSGRRADPPPQCRVELDPEFIDGLHSIEGFSHLILLYWLHLATVPEMIFTPPRGTEPRGVFATRTPRRPNPIGLSVVKFDGLAAPGVLLVRYLDCVDGTPLIDIKPYLATSDSEPLADMSFQGRR